MYSILKSIHVFAVVIFMGNIVTGLFWKRHADQSRDRVVIAHTLRGLIRADRWFTIPGVLVITGAGVLAAVQGGLPLLRTGWIAWSILAFSLSGAAFAWKVAPLQKRLLRMCASPELDWPEYRARSLEWELWGLFATLAPAVAIVLMISKPAL